MENPHDKAGFEELTEDEQRIQLTEYSLECHREALEIMRDTAGIALVSEQVMAREIGKLGRSLAELRSRQLAGMAG